MENRRQFQRVNLEILVIYGKKAPAKTLNMSEDGICLLVEKPLEIKSFLTLTFPLPNNIEIKAIGKVVWNREIEPDPLIHGIEFWKIDESDKNALKQYINSQVKNKRRI